MILETLNYDTGLDHNRPKFQPHAVMVFANVMEFPEQR